MPACFFETEVCGFLGRQMCRLEDVGKIQASWRLSRPSPPPRPNGPRRLSICDAEGVRLRSRRDEVATGR
eukprot:scaffold3127_cov202-Prasinococcus_capsulatus_cf.AAC.15